MAQMDDELKHFRELNASVQETGNLNSSNNVLIKRIATTNAILTGVMLELKLMDR